MDLASPTIHKNGNQLHVSHGNDDGLYVEFENIPIQNMSRTETEGRPIFEEVPYIKIMFPGDKTKQVHKPVNDQYKARFPRQWAAFEAQESQVVSGTPITEWAPLTKSQSAEFKAMNIHTVEALAALPDTALTWLGSRSYRDKAVAWLAGAKDGSAVIALQTKCDNQATDIAMLKEQIKELSTQKEKKDTKNESKI